MSSSCNLKSTWTPTHDQFSQEILEKSNGYIDSLQKLFEDSGYIVSRCQGSLPDDDFVYMANANHFVRVGGGFSEYFAKVVERLGHKSYCEGLPAEPEQGSLGLNLKGKKDWFESWWKM